MGQPCRFSSHRPPVHYRLFCFFVSLCGPFARLLLLPPSPDSSSPSSSSLLLQSGPRAIPSFRLFLVRQPFFFQFVKAYLFFLPYPPLSRVSFTFTLRSLIRYSSWLWVLLFTSLITFRCGFFLSRASPLQAEVYQHFLTLSLSLSLSQILFHSLPYLFENRLVNAICENPHKLHARFVCFKENFISLWFFSMLPCGSFHLEFPNSTEFNMYLIHKVQCFEATFIFSVTHENFVVSYLRFFLYNLLC